MAPTDSPHKLYARHIQNSLQKEQGSEIPVDYSWCLYLVIAYINKAQDEARRMDKGPTSANVKSVLLEVARTKWRKEHPRMEEV
jgi:hypothetical protein